MNAHLRNYYLTSHKIISSDKIVVVEMGKSIAIAFFIYKGENMKIRTGRLADLDDVMMIEEANFSIDEAASRDAMIQRLQIMTDTFLVIEDNENVAGYIEGPVISQPYITDDLFHKVSQNAETGGYIAITSLSISPFYKGQGLGTMLIAAMKDLAIETKRKGITLTCHEELIPFYELNGFTDEGLSESKHGGSVWYNMLWKSENV